MNLKKLSLYGLGPIFAALLGLITLPVCTWFFPQDEIGMLALYQASINLCFILTNLGLNQAYVREYHEASDKNKLFVNTTIPSLIFFLALSGLYFTGIKEFFDLSFFLSKKKSLMLEVCFLLGVFAFYLNNHLQHVIRMNEDALAYSLSMIVPKLFFLLLIIVIPQFKEVSFETLALAFSVSALFNFFIFWKVIHLKEQGTFSPSISEQLSLLRFSIPLVIGSLAFWGTRLTDRFFIQHFINTSDLAVYSIAVTLAGGLGVFTTIFSNIWHPTLFKWLKRGLKVTLINKVSRVITDISLIVLSLVGFIAPVTSLFLPEGYEGISVLIVPACIIPMFYMISESTVVGISITKRSIYSLYISVFTLLISMTLNYILVPVLGIKGASIVGVITFILFLILRTEASCYLWENIERKLIYFKLIVFSLIAIIYLLLGEEIAYLNFSFLLFASVLLVSKNFRKDVLELKNEIRA